MARKKREPALELVEKLIPLCPNEDTRALAIALRQRMLLPMTMVLEKLWPGETVASKARHLNVSRTTYYAWLEGRTRPRFSQAQLLAEETGFPWQAIAGRPPGSNSDAGEASAV